jgi:hypothetical protein
MLYLVVIVREDLKQAISCHRSAQAKYMKAAGDREGPCRAMVTKNVLGNEP